MTEPIIQARFLSQMKGHGYHPQSRVLRGDVRPISAKKKPWRTHLKDELAQVSIERHKPLNTDRRPDIIYEGQVNEEENENAKNFHRAMAQEGTLDLEPVKTPVSSPSPQPITRSSSRPIVKKYPVVHAKNESYSILERKAAALVHQPVIKRNQNANSNFPTKTMAKKNMSEVRHCSPPKENIKPVLRSTHIKRSIKNAPASTRKIPVEKVKPGEKKKRTLSPSKRNKAIDESFHNIFKSSKDELDESQSLIFLEEQLGSIENEQIPSEKRHSKRSISWKPPSQHNNSISNEPPKYNSKNYDPKVNEHAKRLFHELKISSTTDTATSMTDTIGRERIRYEHIPDTVAKDKKKMNESSHLNKMSEKIVEENAPIQTISTHKRNITNEGIVEELSYGRSAFEPNVEDLFELQTLTHPNPSSITIPEQDNVRVGDGLTKITKDIIRARHDLQAQATTDTLDMEEAFRLMDGPVYQPHPNAPQENIIFVSPENDDGLVQLSIEDIDCMIFGNSVPVSETGKRKKKRKSKYDPNFDLFKDNQGSRNLDLESETDLDSECSDSNNSTSDSMFLVSLPPRIKQSRSYNRSNKPKSSFVSDTLRDLPKNAQGFKLHNTIHQAEQVDQMLDIVEHKTNQISQWQEKNLQVQKEANAVQEKLQQSIKYLEEKTEVQASRIQDTIKKMIVVVEEQAKHPDLLSRVGNDEPYNFDNMAERVKSLLLMDKDFDEMDQIAHHDVNPVIINKQVDFDDMRFQVAKKFQVLNADPELAHLKRMARKHPRTVIEGLRKAETKQETGNVILERDEDHIKHYISKLGISAQDTNPTDASTIDQSKKTKAKKPEKKKSSTKMMSLNIRKPIEETYVPTKVVRKIHTRVSASLNPPPCVTVAVHKRQEPALLTKEHKQKPQEPHRVEVEEDSHPEPVIVTSAVPSNNTNHIYDEHTNDEHNDLDKSEEEDNYAHVEEPVHEYAVEEEKFTAPVTTSSYAPSVSSEIKKPVMVSAGTSTRLTMDEEEAMELRNRAMQSLYFGQTAIPGNDFTSQVPVTQERNIVSSETSTLQRTNQPIIHNILPTHKTKSSTIVAKGEILPSVGVTGCGLNDNWNESSNAHDSLQSALESVLSHTEREEVEGDEELPFHTINNDSVLVDSSMYNNQNTPVLNLVMRLLETSQDHMNDHLDAEWSRIVLGKENKFEEDEPEHESEHESEELYIVQDNKKINEDFESRKNAYAATLQQFQQVKEEKDRKRNAARALALEVQEYQAEVKRRRCHQEQEETLQRQKELENMKQIQKEDIRLMHEELLRVKEEEKKQNEAIVKEAAVTKISSFYRGCSERKKYVKIRNDHRVFLKEEARKKEIRQNRRWQLLKAQVAEEQAQTEMKRIEEENAKNIQDATLKAMMLKEEQENKERLEKQRQAAEKERVEAEENKKRLEELAIKLQQDAFEQQRQSLIKKHQDMLEERENKIRQEEEERRKLEQLRFDTQSELHNKQMGHLQSEIDQLKQLMISLEQQKQQPIAPISAPVTVQKEQKQPLVYAMNLTAISDTSSSLEESSLIDDSSIVSYDESMSRFESSKYLSEGELDMTSESGNVYVFQPNSHSVDASMIGIEEDHEDLDESTMDSIFDS